MADDQHQEMQQPDEQLRFKVAPHIVQDLGLNLYTSLPRVLVEFVANAYDADAKTVIVKLDKEGIDSARNIVRAQFELDRASAAKGDTVAPLDDRVLADEVTIEIRDDGVGMNKADLQLKFLVAGRRRRVLDNSAVSGAGARSWVGKGWESSRASASHKSLPSLARWKTRLTRRRS